MASYPEGNGTFWRNVNAAAVGDLDTIERWLKYYFPKARRRRKAWRITSRDLGRNLQEDLSFAVGGGRDFGEEQNKTPISVLIEHGHATDARDAAFKICRQIGISPKALGWIDRTKTAAGQ